ncbi:MAG TPA: hypothetical protein VFV87_23260, partial [Pirellulaceae bacterium]|nr:hypothetical protein [Pirellulaceae bacterium]
MASQLKCSKCQTLIPSPASPEVEHVQCPGCGARFRIRRSASSTPAPVATAAAQPASAKTAPAPLSDPDDEYRLAAPTPAPQPLPRPPVAAIDPLGRPAGSQALTAAREPASGRFDLRILIGAGMGGGALLLVLVIGVVAWLVMSGGGNGPGQNGVVGNPPGGSGKLSTTAVVFDTADPNIKPDPPGDVSQYRQTTEGPPQVWTAIAVLPPATTQSLVGGASMGNWDGEPDPAPRATPLPVETAFQFTTRPIFAAQDGPFAVEAWHRDRADLLPPDEPLGQDDQSRGLGAFPVYDLRTGEAV